MMVTETVSAKTAVTMILSRPRKNRSVQITVTNEGVKILEGGKTVGKLCRAHVITYIKFMPLTNMPGILCLAVGDERVCHVFGGEQKLLTAIEQETRAAIIHARSTKRNGAVGGAAGATGSSSSSAAASPSKRPSSLRQSSTGYDALSEEAQLELALRQSVLETTGGGSGGPLDESQRKALAAAGLSIEGLSEQEQVELALRQSQVEFDREAAASGMSTSFDKSNPFSFIDDSDPKTDTTPVTMATGAGNINPNPFTATNPFTTPPRAAHPATTTTTTNNMRRTSISTDDGSLDVDVSGAASVWHAAQGRNSLVGTPSSETSRETGTPTRLATSTWQAAGALAAAAETLNVIQSDVVEVDDMADAEYAALLASIESKVERDTGYSLNKVRRPQAAAAAAAPSSHENPFAPSVSNPFTGAANVPAGGGQGTSSAGAVGEPSEEVDGDGMYPRPEPTGAGDDDDDLLYGGADSWDAVSPVDEYGLDDDDDMDDEDGMDDDGDNDFGELSAPKQNASYFAEEEDVDDVGLDDLYVDSDPEDPDSVATSELIGDEAETEDTVMATVVESTVLADDAVATVAVTSGDAGTSGDASGGGGGGGAGDVGLTGGGTEHGPVVEVFEPGRERADTYMYEGSDDEDFSMSAVGQSVEANAPTPVEPVGAPVATDADLDGDIAQWLEAHSPDAAIDDGAVATVPLPPTSEASPAANQVSTSVPDSQPSLDPESTVIAAPTGETQPFGVATNPFADDAIAPGDPQYEDEDEQQGRL
eukprot:m.120645 g.120645  ORF g.120645 m.120645 type:complete len:764 (-) comp11063_c0_seq3:199-2490(-)